MNTEMAAIYVAVEMAVENLTYHDLISLNVTAQLGIDPRDKPWYPHISHLFDKKDGTKMSDITREVLLRVLLKRREENV